MAIKLSPANVDHLLQIANRLSKNAHTFSVTAEILEIAQRQALNFYKDKTCEP